MYNDETRFKLFNMGTLNKMPTESKTLRGSYNGHFEKLI